jgi:hypothetical protein
MACALLALLAGQVHGHSCNLGYETDSIPCMGTFYVSTAKAGGNADIWLSADSTSGLEQALVSRNGAFRAKMQNDGNFVVYFGAQSPLWNAGTNAGSPWRLTVQRDGNVVRYSNVPSALGSASCSACPGGQCPCAPSWNSDTSNQGSARGPFRLVMQNDGNLVLYNNADEAPWSTWTVQPGYASDIDDISLSKGACDSCAACAAGKYRDAAHAACTDCIAGKYSAAVGAITVDTCSNCQAGKYSVVVGAYNESVCLYCPAGRYSAAGASVCTDCEAGKYSVVVGAYNESVCLYCLAGRYSAAGASVCTDCEAGKVSSAVGATAVDTCLDCIAGKYAEANASTACTNCIANSNSMTGSDAASDCICNAGFTSHGAGGNPATKLCRKCPVNVFKDWAGDEVRA